MAKPANGGYSTRDVAALQERRNRLLRFKKQFDGTVILGEIEIMQRVYVGRVGALAPSYDVYRVVVDGVRSELNETLAYIDVEFEQMGIKPDVFKE